MTSDSRSYLIGPAPLRDLVVMTIDQLLAEHDAATQIGSDRARRRYLAVVSAIGRYQYTDAEWNRRVFKHMSDTTLRRMAAPATYERPSAPAEPPSKPEAVPLTAFEERLRQVLSRRPGSGC